MDASLSRSNIVRKRDPHGWNSYDHYRTIHEKCLAEHSFINESQPNTIEFAFLELNGVLFLRMAGRCYCRRGVLLEVDKLFETRYSGRVLQIRGIRYVYVAWITGSTLVLKYHNVHQDPQEYVHRAYDPNTGNEILYETLTRFQFPVFTEILDESEVLTRALEK